MGDLAWFSDTFKSDMILGASPRLALWLLGGPLLLENIHV